MCRNGSPARYGSSGFSSPPIRPSPRWLTAAAPSGTGEAAPGSRRASARPTSTCIAVASRTAWKSGATIDWWAACMASASAACSPGSRCFPVIGMRRKWPWSGSCRCWLLTAVHCSTCRWRPTTSRSLASSRSTATTTAACCSRRCSSHAAGLLVPQRSGGRSAASRRSMSRAVLVARESRSAPAPPRR